jgi:hypothetical protein
MHRLFRRAFLFGVRFVNDFVALFPDLVGDERFDFMERPFAFARTVSATSCTLRFTIGLASPVSSANWSKFLGVILSDSYSPPIFIAIFLARSG